MPSAISSDFDADNLLVRAALEAILDQNPHRYDANARHDRTLAAALMECAEKGYPKLTIAQIAKRAKVSTATIYQDYKDRDALLVAAVEMLLAILASDVIALPDTEDPVQKVQQLLLAHGHVYAEPISTWMFRLHATLAWSGHPHLHAQGLRIFNAIDRFWGELLASLVVQGHLVAMDTALVTALILGPIERATIMSRLLFGDRPVDRLDLNDVATFSARVLFSAWGSEAFWASPMSQALAPRLPISPPFETANPAPISSARPSVQTDAAQVAGSSNRHARILEFAMQECQERGYNDASMLEIAARAQVSSATLYKIFGDKETLLLTALDNTTQRLEAEFAALSSTSMSLAQALTHIANLSAAPDHAWIYNVMMASEISGSRKMVEIAWRYSASVEKSLSAVLARQSPELANGQEALDLTINFLLGGIERCAALSLVLFGQENVDHARLAQVVGAEGHLGRLS